MECLPDLAQMLLFFFDLVAVGTCAASTSEELVLPDYLLFSRDDLLGDCLSCMEVGPMLETPALDLEFS